MANIDVTKMSSKGQVVIPREMREDFQEGEKLVVIRAGRQLILEKVKDFSKTIEEDLEFAKRTGRQIVVLGRSMNKYITCAVKNNMFPLKNNVQIFKRQVKRHDF